MADRERPRGGGCSRAEPAPAARPAPPAPSPALRSTPRGRSPGRGQPRRAGTVPGSASPGITARPEQRRVGAQRRRLRSSREPPGTSRGRAGVSCLPAAPGHPRRAARPGQPRGPRGRWTRRLRRLRARSSRGPAAPRYFEWQPAAAARPCGLRSPPAGAARGGSPVPGGPGPDPPEGSGPRLPGPRCGQRAGRGRARAAAIARGPSNGELQLPARPAAPRLGRRRPPRLSLAFLARGVTNPCGNGAGRLAGAAAAAANGRRSHRRCGLWGWLRWRGAACWRSALSLRAPARSPVRGRSRASRRRPGVPAVPGSAGSCRAAVVCRSVPPRCPAGGRCRARPERSGCGPAALPRDGDAPVPGALGAAPLAAAVSARMRVGLS